MIGAGFSQFLIVFSFLLMRKSAFIFIDKPELNLHPSLQAKFVSTLRSFASNGVVFSTHNIGLARAAADRIYTVRRKNGFSSVQHWEKTGRLSEPIGEMGFSAYEDLGFDAILLVEGPTEIKTVQQILRMLDKDHKIVPMHLGGSSMINGTRGSELLEVTRITKKIFVLIDSEKSSDTSSIPGDRVAFSKSCERLGVSCHVTHRRATENYLTDAAVKKAKCERFRALGPFEALGSAPGLEWGKNDNWLIAREMSAADWMATDFGEFLNEI